MDSGSDLAFSAVSIFHSRVLKKRIEPFTLSGWHETFRIANNMDIGQNGSACPVGKLVRG
jgi:hypothetical protein